MTTSTKALIERAALALYQAKTTLDERGEPLYKPGKRLIEHCLDEALSGHEDIQDAGFGDRVITVALHGDVEAQIQTLTEQITLEQEQWKTQTDKASLNKQNSTTTASTARKCLKQMLKFVLMSWLGRLYMAVTMSIQQKKNKRQLSGEIRR